MQINNNTNLLAIKDLEIKKVLEGRDFVHIECLHIHKRVCPFCCSSHNWLHDHRIHELKDPPMRKERLLYRFKKLATIASLVVEGLNRLFLLPPRANK